MRELAIVLGLCLLAFPAAAQPATEGPAAAADAVRSALARRYLELARPDWLNGDFEVHHALAYFTMPRTLEEANLLIKKQPPSSSPWGRIVYGQLKASFELGARRLAPKMADALVAVYAEQLTREELQTLISFEEQPSQRVAASTSARASKRLWTYSDGLGARWDAELKAGVARPMSSPPSSGLLDGLTPAEPPDPAAPASPIWTSITAKQNLLYLATYDQLSRLWPQAAAIAIADYCSHVRCRASDRGVLTGLGQVFANPNNPV